MHILVAVIDLFAQTGRQTQVFSVAVPELFLLILNAKRTYNAMTSATVFTTHCWLSKPNSSTTSSENLFFSATMLSAYNVHRELLLSKRQDENCCLICRHRVQA